MRRLSSKNIDTVPSIEKIEFPATVAVACAEVRRFLMEIITKENTDVIISTLRKGSWIIDDILRVYGLNITHFTNKRLEEVPKEDLFDKHILVFDDSIHEGKSIINILSKINMPCSVRVACIAINDEAVEKIEKEGIDLVYLERFRDYTKYGDNGELVPGCQTYYYAYFMIPYISNLSVNYSPDYKSLSIIVKGGLPKDLTTMTDSVVSVLTENVENDSYEVDSTMYTRRVSLSIDKEYMGLHLSELKIPYETDLSKLRVSASICGGFSEIVITPMLCPICEDVEGVYMKGLPFYLSEKFIEDYRNKITDRLRKNGFDILQQQIIIGTAGSNETQQE